MRPKIVTSALLLAAVGGVSIAVGSNAGTVTTPTGAKPFVPSTETHVLSSGLFSLNPNWGGEDSAIFSITNVASTPSTYTYELLDKNGQQAGISQEAGAIWTSPHTVTVAGGTSFVSGSALLLKSVRFVVKEVTNSGAQATAKPLGEVFFRGTGYFDDNTQENLILAPIMIEDFSDMTIPTPPLTTS